MTDDPSYLVGEGDKHYTPYHKVSSNWATVTTELLLQPSASTTYLITRLGFTVYDASNNFAQDIKIDLYDGQDWETIFAANDYASIANVASRVDSFKIGDKDVVSFLWWYNNGIKVHGMRGEQLKIYPSALITNCDDFYCGVRYFEFI